MLHIICEAHRELFCKVWVEEVQWAVGRGCLAVGVSPVAAAALPLPHLSPKTPGEPRIHLWHPYLWHQVWEMLGDHFLYHSPF